MMDIQRIQSALAYIPAHDRDTWLNMGMAVKDALGDRGFEIWNDWSQSAKNYQERDAIAVWRSIKPGKVRAGSLFHEAKRRGYTPTDAGQRPNSAEIERQCRERAKHEAKAAAELAALNAKVRDQAQEIWKRCGPLAVHDYATAKGINAYGARLYKGPLIISETRLDGSLVTPLVDTAGIIHTLQYITPEGKKLYPYGGAKSGHYFAIGKPDQQIIICEGYATACSIHEATGEAVAVAFDRTNLAPVASAIRAKYPDLALVIAADNDAWTDGNPGVKDATEAARAVNARLIVPAFEDASSKPTDFNDLHKLEGLEAVRAQIEKAEDPKPAGAGLSTLSAPYASAVSGVDPDGWPEPQSIDNSLCAVTPLAPEIIPEPMRDWFNDIADRMQCNIDYVAVSGIVSLASIVGAGCGVRPKQLDDWEAVPNLWGGAVGKPSTLKTPALSAAMRPLLELEREANRKFENERVTHEVDKFANEAAIQSIKEKLKHAKNDDEKLGLKDQYAKLLNDAPVPTWKRYKTNDPTQEKMGELLRDNPRGLLYYRDELMGFFSSLDKDGRESDRAFFLEAWNGNATYTSDRVARGTIQVDNLCVSLLGSIQPAKLTGYLYRAMRGNDNDGLVQRLQVLVYPDEAKWSYVDRKPNVEAAARAMQIYRTLDGMDFIEHGASKGEFDKRPWFRFSPEAQELFTAWLSELENRKLRADCESIMIEHLSKYRSLMPSLALLFHLVDVADSKATGPITLRAASLAAEWCDYLESHARRIYGIVSNIIPRAAAVLIGKIKAGALPDPFKTTHVYRPHWELLDYKNADEVCEYLAALGWIRDVTPIYPGIGRPPATEYAINPKIKRQAAA